MRKQQKPDKTDDGFDDAPPVLVPEENPTSEEVVIDNELQQQDPYDEGTYALGDQYFVDNGVLYQKPQTTGMGAPTHSNTLEFNFLDPGNICCGLCGDIVPYDTLMTEHLPIFHPEVLSDGVVDLEEIPYEAWLNEKMQVDSKAGILPGSGPMPSTGMGFGSALRYQNSIAMHRPPVHSTRTLRRISQIRVNINEMSLEELDLALNKKMVEKMGRKVAVSLVDKQHARCGICSSVVSLNKKFEVVHLVRHFNAWHPSAHKCAGNWLSRCREVGPPIEGIGKPLSTHDFSVMDTNINAAENLQCIWCGMFMDGKALAMHFHEVHPDEIEVPKCNLCLQEIVINARFTEKYGEDFNITLPDEHHLRCGKFDTKHNSEAALDKAIAKQINHSMNDDDDEGPSGENKRTSSGVAKGCELFSNSRMTFGRRSKPKRQFIQPALRQAVPVNSLYVEQVDDCHWRCRLCRSDILAAVISAGAIRHYRHYHPNQLQSMQFELCKARLERVSDGCMEFLNVETIECLICTQSFPLHRPFNMCRAIRHLKAKHPEKMPEYNGGQELVEVDKIRKRKYNGMRAADPGGDLLNIGDLNNEDMEDGVMYITEIIAHDQLQSLHDQYHVDFEKVFQIRGKSIPHAIFVLTNEGEEITEESAHQIVKQVEGATIEDSGPIVVQYSRAGLDEDLQMDQHGYMDENGEILDGLVTEDGVVIETDDQENAVVNEIIVGSGEVGPTGTPIHSGKTETIEDDGVVDMNELEDKDNMFMQLGGV